MEVQLNGWLLGSVMVKVTAPLGCSAPAIPVTVAVKVVVPLIVGLLEAVRVMVGTWSAKVRVTALEVAAL